MSHHYSGHETLGQCLDSYLELGAQGTRGGIILAWNKDMISVTNAVNRNFTISATIKVISSDTFPNDYMLWTYG